MCCAYGHQHSRYYRMLLKINKSVCSDAKRLGTAYSWYPAWGKERVENKKETKWLWKTGLAFGRRLSVTSIWGNGSECWWFCPWMSCQKGWSNRISLFASIAKNANAEFISLCANINAKHASILLLQRIIAKQPRFSISHLGFQNISSED